MTKPESYPFLRIARQYGYDYGDVLNMVETVRRTGSMPIHWLPRAVACKEIYVAMDQFEDIQLGDIDWMTGDKTDEMDYGDGKSRY